MSNFEEQTTTLFHVREYGETLNRNPRKERYFKTLELAKLWVQYCGRMYPEELTWIDLHTNGWIAPTSEKTGWKITSVALVENIEEVEYSDNPQLVFDSVLSTTSGGTMVNKRKRTVIHTFTIPTQEDESS